jgi:hypothetical protein
VEFVVKAYSRSHLSDPALLQTAAEQLAQNRASVAEFIADLAEIDERRLYLPAGYPSLHAWCVGELHLSEDSALKRIQAARAARQFPIIFSALADGRLHMTAVCLLAPHLRPTLADERLASAAGTTKDEIRLLLARRFPSSEMLPMVEPLPRGEHALAHVDSCSGAGVSSDAEQHAPAHVDVPPSKVEPVAAERFGIHVTNPVARGGASTVENLRLRCGAHNQYEAERIFGAEFMSRKRRAATERRTSVIRTIVAHSAG